MWHSAYLMVSYISLRLRSLFFVIGSLCSSACITFLDLSSSLLTILPVQIYCWTPQGIFSFQFYTFHFHNFHLVLFIISISLSVFFIWWDVVILVLLSMAPFSSSNTFMVATLTFICDIWHLVPLTGSLSSALFLHMGHTFLCLCISCNFLLLWKTGHFRQCYSNCGYWFLTPPLGIVTVVCLFTCLVTGWPTEVTSISAAGWSLWCCASEGPARACAHVHGHLGMPVISQRFSTRPLHWLLLHQLWADCSVVFDNA